MKKTNDIANEFDVSNVVTDGNNFVLVDKEAEIKAGDTAYSVDIGFYKVEKGDIIHANENHYKVISVLVKEPVNNYQSLKEANAALIESINFLFSRVKKDSLPASVVSLFEETLNKAKNISQ